MKLSYRPEIDGLRAIAVVSVILYHLQITIFSHQFFKGGFIGVDIFFVISGYLITSIILKELVTTGTFSFKHFYERRVRRILPLLLLVMLISLPFAWNYLLPINLIEFSKSVLYSLGFNSNFFFHFSKQQYGAASGLYMPFLHTWSLSVEEQYYILFPVIFFYTFKYLNKYLIYILTFGFFISLSIADWGSRHHPSLNFYILPTRGWELLAGSILAYFEIKLGQRSKYQILNLIFPSIGLFLIGHSILFFNVKMLHPSYYTLSPVIGVCLIIWFSNKKELITKMLSSKLFVGTGLISYSLYLWHYPIFVFDRIIEFNYLGIFDNLIMLFVIVFLSIVSYFYIEKPARNKSFKSKFILTPIIFFSFFIIIFNYIIIDKGGFKYRVPSIFHNDMTQNNWNLLKNAENEICHDNEERCVFNPTAKKKIYIVGDSIMGTIMFDLKNRVVDKNYSFITSTIISCLYFPGFDMVNIKINKIHKKCNNNYFTELQKILNKQQDSIIIFGGNFAERLSNKTFNNNFDNKEGGGNSMVNNFKYIPNGTYDSIESSFLYSLEELSKKNKIILIYPIPEVGWDVPSKLLNSLPKKNKDIDEYLVLENFITTSFEVFRERSQSSFELLDSIQGDNIFRVYPHKLFCNTLIQNRCLTHDNKNIFYSDSSHPSVKGSEMINYLIIKVIEKIENSN